MGAAIEIMSSGIPKAEEDKGDNEGKRAAFVQLAKAILELRDHPKYRGSMSADAPGRGDDEVEADGVEAMENLFAILDGEPHEEGSHTGSDADD